jgi:hypothetical protein
MINSLNIQRLLIAEFVQFIGDGLGIVNGLPAVAAAVATPKAVVTTKFGELNGLFMTDQASALTDDLAALDAQRDGMLTGLQFFTKSFTYHTDPAYRDAGETLSRNLEIYGDIARKGYNAESASITNLVTDWTTKTELIAASNLVNAGDFIAPLGTINASFIVLYNQRTQEMSTTINNANLTEKRVEVTAAWKVLTDKLNANIVLNDGTGVWGQVQDQLNALIAQYKDTLAARAGRRAAAANGNGQTPPPPPPGGSTGGVGAAATI